MSESYIVEHATRGILMDLEYDTLESRYNPRWSWSKPRSEAQRFFSLGKAIETVAKIPERQRPLVTILEFGTWDQVMT